MNATRTTVSRIWETRICRWLSDVDVKMDVMVVLSAACSTRLLLPEEICPNCYTTAAAANNSVENIELFPGYSPTLLQFAALCCLLFMGIGLPGNLITIVALFGCKKELNATAIFIINLSVSDFMFCIFNLPLAASTFWLRRWTQGDHLCKLYPLMRYGLVAVSLFTILAITINRYIMISHPNIYPRLYHKGYLLTMVVSTWLCAFGTLVPTWFGRWGRFGLDTEVGSCSILKDDDGYSPKRFLFVVAFIIPCFFIAICYARIFHIVRKTGRRSHTIANRNNTVAATITAARSAVTTACAHIHTTASDSYYPVSKSNRMMVHNSTTEESAISCGAAAVNSGNIEKSTSSVIANEKVASRRNTRSQEPVVLSNDDPDCPNLLPPPPPPPPPPTNRPLYCAKIAADHSSCSGLDDDFAQQYPSCRSISPTSSCNVRPANSSIRCPQNGNTLSAVETTFYRMATVHRRNHNSPSMRVNRRRRNALPQPGKMSSKDKKLLKMILVIFSSFVVCYLPITITKTSEYLRGVHVLNICGYLLIYLTTCINPIIYVVMSSEYRQAYKNLLTCRVLPPDAFPSKRFPSQMTKAGAKVSSMFPLSAPN